MTGNVASIEPSHTPDVAGDVTNDPHSHTFSTGSIINTNPNTMNNTNIGDDDLSIYDVKESAGGSITHLASTFLFIFVGLVSSIVVLYAIERTIISI